MKKLLFVIGILILSITASKAQFYQDDDDLGFKATNIRPLVNFDDKTVEILFDILDESGRNLFIIDMRYLEGFSGKTIVPVASSISGDIGDFAIAGGQDRRIFWDLNKQDLQSLEWGDIEISVELVNKKASPGLFRLSRRKIRLESKLQKNNLRSGKIRRIKRRLKRVERKIKGKN